MVYPREESFFGHVHRHPARLCYEHGATRDGRLVFVRAEILLDGGAYTSSTPSVFTNATVFGTGPYVVPNVSIDGWGVYTNNPPCGAMRGFGAVQCAFAYESQMDRLAEAVHIDRAEIRIRNGLASDDRVPTGQVVDSITPVAELVRRLRERPLPAPADADPRHLPGGIGNTTYGEGVARGVGYGVGIKNVCYTAGFDDYATARVRLELQGGEPVARVHTAAVEVGQGLVTVQTQVVRTELGVDKVVLEVPDTRVGNAGSSSASRQTYMSAGALRAVCQAVAAVVLRRAAQRDDLDVAGLRLQDGVVVSDDGVVIAELKHLLHEPVDETAEWRHRPTTPIDAETGQGDAHVQLALAAHRAVVDVDTELGLVKVVALDCVQDVGLAVNPRGVVGQIFGASAQGLGLALMEEIQVVDGVVKNPSFVDYLIPTILDIPQMHVDVLELADPSAPYGIRGVGEPALLSATTAIVAAVRQATGRTLTRVPVRPEDIAGVV